MRARERERECEREREARWEVEREKTRGALRLVSFGDILREYLPGEPKGIRPRGSRWELVLWFPVGS